MAQWQGQFTGRTHASKVADRETTLRATIAACSGKSPGDGSLPNLESLAQRVIEARHQCLKARLSALREPSGTAPPLAQIERLEKQIDGLGSGGIAAILREFHCPQPISDSIMLSNEPG
ncbi:hypothetical protein GCM10023212_32910 [Luteolibacter yonseiensis]